MRSVISPQAALDILAQNADRYDPKVVEALVQAQAKEQSSVLNRLTERELEVLGEMAQGGTNAAIGEALFISPRSVEKHINSIFTKLDLSQTEDIHRRVSAVLLFLAENR